MEKIAVTLSESEERIVLQALNRLRTDLINEGKYTDIADELIMKVAKAPFRKTKIA